MFTTTVRTLGDILVNRQSPVSHKSFNFSGRSGYTRETDDAKKAFQESLKNSESIPPLAEICRGCVVKDGEGD